MELATFGAIMSFAIEMERRALGFFHEAATREGLEVRFGEMANRARKRLARAERARREGVAEMILESIEGLRSEDFEIDLSPGADESQLVEQAATLAETASRFYHQAASKVPIKEVSRLLGRMAREWEQQLSDLQQMSP